MAFVPMVVPPQPAASARAQDLGRRLKAEVEKFETQYPGTTREDLRAAAAIAIGEESAAVPPRRRLAAALVAGITGLGVAAAVVSDRGAVGTSWPILAMIVVAGCAGLFAAVIRRSRR